MAYSCFVHGGECDGCMECQSEDPILTDIYGDNIYENDLYYEIEGDIILDDNILEYLDRYKTVAKKYD